MEHLAHPPTYRVYRLYDECEICVQTPLTVKIIIMTVLQTQILWTFVNILYTHKRYSQFRYPPKTFLNYNKK